MASTDPYAAYKSTQTLTASKTKLIVMLHDGAIRFLALAAEATVRKDFPNKGKYFGKTFDILTHLIGTLDKENGGQLADDLDRFYRFFTAQLMVANAKNDAKLIKNVMAHLRTVRDAWATVDAQAYASSPPIERDGIEGLRVAA